MVQVSLHQPQEVSKCKLLKMKWAGFYCQVRAGCHAL